MNVKLTNGTELEALLVTGAPQFIQGDSRDCLTFVFPAETELGVLDKAFSTEACESISLSDGSTESIHKGYTIRVELAKKPVEVSKATEGTEAVFEQRVTLTMAQRTYTESVLSEMQSNIANMEDVLDYVLMNE